MTPAELKRIASDLSLTCWVRVFIWPSTENPLRGCIQTRAFFYGEFVEFKLPASLHDEMILKHGFEQREVYGILGYHITLTPEPSPDPIDFDDIRSLGERGKEGAENSKSISGAAGCNTCRVLNRASFDVLAPHAGTSVGRGLGWKPSSRRFEPVPGGWGERPAESRNLGKDFATDEESDFEVAA